MPLILALHGSFGECLGIGVHDAGYCLADSATGKIEALVEMEKVSQRRHDGALCSELIEAELAGCSDRRYEVITSHFTSFAGSSARPFPPVKDVLSFDWNDVRAFERSEIEFLAQVSPHYVYLHELAHVFSSYMYRQRDDDRFLGLVIEQSGAFAQSSVFLVEGFRARLVDYNLPLLSGGFFHQWLSRMVFDAAQDDRPSRSAAAGKVMALAAYGDRERFRRPLFEAVRRHGPRQYINYRERFCPEIEKLALSWRDRVDLCASGQQLFEDLIVEAAVRLRERHGAVPVYYGGGCALSIKANSRLRRVFDDLTIAPACGDEGMALGLASLHAFLERRSPLAPLGSGNRLTTRAVPEIAFAGSLAPQEIETVARWLAAGEVVAFAQGAPEIGPRALCRRSILANPATPLMREVLNHIKGREYFRPVAPVVLDSAGSRLFEGYFRSPFMLYDFPVRPEFVARIPAAVHADGTARPQSVPDDDSDIARLLRAFAELTGNAPLLLNTSLNSRGRPIAATRAHVTEELARLKITHAVLGGEAFVLD